MELKNLCDYPQYSETIARWIYDEFIDGIKARITYDMVLSSFKKRKKDSLPLTIVALENKECLGTVSLVENDLKLRDYTPWLAALYVAEEHRKRGIGQVLVKKSISLANELGYNELFLRTEYAADYYKKLNWAFVEELVDEFGIHTKVFKKKLSNE